MVVYAWFSPAAAVGSCITEPLPGGRGSSIRLGFVTFAPTRILDGIKSLSYAGNMLASRLARERGFDEALLVTPHGRVLEAPDLVDLLGRTDGALCTPPLDEHILASITRDRLIKLLDVEERAHRRGRCWRPARRSWPPPSREVQPIAAIEDRDLGEPGERTRDAAARFAGRWSRSWRLDG